MKQLDVINFKSFAKELSNIQHYVVSQLEKKHMAQKHATDLFGRSDMLFSVEKCFLIVLIIFKKTFRLNRSN